MPKLFNASCTCFDPPPKHLQDDHTGADPEIFDHFFSNPIHEKYFESILDRLEVKILNGPFQRGGCAAVVVFCHSGTSKDSFEFKTSFQVIFFQ